MALDERGDVARRVADLNGYGRALNRCESVDEVVSLTLEAMSLLVTFASATFVEVTDGDLEILHSTNPAFEPGDAPSDLARRAAEVGETTAVTGTAARVDGDGAAAAAVAVPATTVDEVTAVLVTRTTREDALGDGRVRPLEILAAHAATAIGNIRSRERLERARQDLETRNEMIGMYDRLLRHDLGNDLQVIEGFADALAGEVDGEAAEHAARIQRAARDAGDLIDRVGELVSTLEERPEPEPRELRPVVTSAAEAVAARYDALSVEYDPAAFEHRVYADDLLESVLSNVLSNAAVHNDGPVTARLYAQSRGRDCLVVGVADDGEGVDPGVREDAFAMGAKGPDSGGSGFGLGFVRALVESYGGRVALGDSEDGGAEVRLHLERV